MATAPQELVSQLQARAQDICQSRPIQEVQQFSVETGWAKSYEEIFAGRFERVLNEDEILDVVLDRGRAILSGRAGDGKTWLLRRLYRQILDHQDMPLFLDLQQWSGADYGEWVEWTKNGIGDAVDFLLRKFGGLGVGAIELDRLPPNVSKILLVDGLNEITSPLGTQILQLLDELVQGQINLSVIVADLSFEETSHPAGSTELHSLFQSNKYAGICTEK